MKLNKLKTLTQLMVIGLTMQSGTAWADRHTSAFSALMNKPSDAYTLEISGVRTSTSPLMITGDFSYVGTRTNGNWSPALPLWNVSPICRKRAFGCTNDGMRVLNDTRLFSALDSFVWTEPETLDETKLSDFTLNVTMEWGSDVHPSTVTTEFTTSLENMHYLHPDGSDAEQDTRDFLIGRGFSAANVDAFMHGAIDVPGLIATWGEEHRFAGDGDEPPTESELKHFTDNVKVTAEAKAKAKVSKEGISAEAEAGIKAETNLTNLFRGIGAAAESAGKAIGKAASWWWHYTKEGADSIRDAVVEGTFVDPVEAMR